MNMVRIEELNKGRKVMLNILGFKQVSGKCRLRSLYDDLQSRREYYKCYEEEKSYVLRELTQN